MWNIRNSVKDDRGREGKLNGKKSERETNHERLWTPGTKLRVTEGSRVGNWVMSIKEGTYGDEPWVQLMSH